MPAQEKVSDEEKKVAQLGSGSGDTASDDTADGDEYSMLIKYIDESAAQKKKAALDGGDEEEGEYTEKRVWYAPWKKTRTSVGGAAVTEDMLTADMLKGLDQSEADARLKRFGFNELDARRENMFIKFLSFWRGPILYVMELAVLLAAGLRDWIDFGVIIGILALNAFVGFIQEKAAGDIVEKLKSGIALRATVIRNGEEHEIEARDLVPGDIVVVEEGQTVPADGRILAEYNDKDRSKAKQITERREASSKKNKANPDGDADDEGDESYVDKGPSVASLDQAAITGESLAVDKYIGDECFFTCGVKRGKVYLVVTNTAKSTFVGKTASLVTGTNDKGHFKIVMDQIGTSLLVLVILFVFIVWIGGFFRNVGIATPKENNLLVYTLIFMIIGVPVGLPCVTTTTLAVGASFLARQQAIVQKLTAIESLAGVDILCSDKTGTLTANKLSINEPFVSEGVDVNWMMAVAALASSHNTKSLDPIDKVTIQTLKDYPKAKEILSQGWTTQKFQPFDPTSKRITAEVTRDGKKYTAAKGAPSAILKLASPSKAAIQQYKATTSDFAKRGFRSLGVAMKEEGQDWQLLGLLPMFDPPRSDTANTIAEAQELGIKIKMLTGDATAIAVETCKMLSMGTNVFDSARLLNSGLTGSKLHDFVLAADGFAEVVPEHKYQVVQMCQARGHLTAMTGDGVNDAPSLKKADCGIAVEGASDAARAAADVVFLDEGLSTIITAIKVSRQIFHRMKAYIIYRIALCLHLEIYLMLSILIKNEVIRVDLIVFIAIFADVATLAIAYDNAPYAKKPVEWQLPKISVISTVLGILLAAGTWIIRGTLFLEGGGVIANFGSVQEILFLEVALTENWLIFLTRTNQGRDGGEFIWPSWQLVGAVLAVDAIATIFCLFGWLSGAAGENGQTFARNGDGWTDIVTVVRVWGFSLGVMLVLTLVYFLLNKIEWLDNLGRTDRGKKNSKMEDFLTQLQQLTIVHNRSDSHDFYTVGNSAPESRDDPHHG
ncbi:uncharacterized protein L969DRAFT_88190 [Mixia osmundae IAM 14324]|nr:uncharacterized protein L969DRAFT_88190 [Mixia osmundae IAM 14324]KEI38852.1 hypothetical protein L969DRAFT_88190 [Mixia osmundae IAM 14324]